MIFKSYLFGESAYAEASLATTGAAISHVVVFSNPFGVQDRAVVDMMAALVTVAAEHIEEALSLSLVVVPGIASEAIPVLKLLGEGTLQIPIVIDFLLMRTSTGMNSMLPTHLASGGATIHSVSNEVAQRTTHESRHDSTGNGSDCIGGPGRGFLHPFIIVSSGSDTVTGTTGFKVVKWACMTLH